MKMLISLSASTVGSLHAAVILKLKQKVEAEATKVALFRGSGRGSEIKLMKMAVELVENQNQSTTSAGIGFLVATKRHYMRTCPSIRPSDGPSVGW